MVAAQITLDAALRDSGSDNPDARNIAVRNLAGELLAELGELAPSWRAAERHLRGAEVVARLRAVAEAEPLPAIRGLAFIGLGQLGDPSVADDANAWLAIEGDDEDAIFLRECAMIALSFVAAAAPGDTEGQPLRGRVMQLFRTALHSAHEELRFQAAVGLSEVGGDAVEADLVDVLAREASVDVRENLVVALSTLEAPTQRTCDALEDVVSGPDGDEGVGFEAALILAGARRVVAGPRLLTALSLRAHRDRALEGLAALGPLAPAGAAEAIAKLARAWLTPPITRVRAAYALARIAPSDGMPLLDRLARSIRPGVREAVADARRGLETLASRDR